MPSETTGQVPHLYLVARVRRTGRRLSGSLPIMVVRKSRATHMEAQSSRRTCGEVPVSAERMMPQRIAQLWLITKPTRMYPTEATDQTANSRGAAVWLNCALAAAQLAGVKRRVSGRSNGDRGGHCRDKEAALLRVLPSLHANGMGNIKGRGKNVGWSLERNNVALNTQGTQILPPDKPGVRNS